jgi:hypothetical protein
MIGRLRLAELSPGRVWQAALRRLAGLPDGLAWSVPTQAARRNRSRLAQYKDRHAGQRAFILGNGPSLAGMDLSHLAGEVTFGMNRVYLLESFRPTYYAAINELVLEQFAEDIRALPCPKFLNWNRRDLFDGRGADTHFVHLRAGFSDLFIPSPLRSLSSGGTVTYVALQLAFYMGFREVILIGVDHNFADHGQPNRVEERTAAADANHFHPDYFPRGARWQLPDLLRSELAYAEARRAYEAAGRRVLDATVGGKLTVFPKVEYSSLFR